MQFKTVKRDEILPMIEQAKDVKEQKKILCDLLDCTMKELDALIRELRAERKQNGAAEREIDTTAKAMAKIAASDELAEVTAYAKKLEGELAESQARVKELKALLETREKELVESRECVKYNTEIAGRALTQKKLYSEALAKSLSLVASLNAVISEVTRT